MAPFQEGKLPDAETAQPDIAEVIRKGVEKLRNHPGFAEPWKQRYKAWAEGRTDVDAEVRSMYFKGWTEANFRQYFDAIEVMERERTGGE